MSRTLFLLNGCIRLGVVDNVSRLLTGITEAFSRP